MSRTDDRIRSELRRGERRVAIDDVVDRIAHRRARRRLVRRTGVAAVAILAIAVTGVSLYGLSRAIAPAPSPGSGDTGVVPTPTPMPTPAVWCDRTSLETDLNGDGSLDLITVYGTANCDREAVAPDAYEVRLDMGPGFDGLRTFTQAVPECSQGWLCHVLSVPDVNGDGRSEVAIQSGAGVSTVIFSLYRFDDETGLQRLVVAAPGDPWHDQFGLAPNADDFVWYGSVTHLHWMSCDEDPEHRLAVMTAVRPDEDPSHYDVHGTLLRLDGSSLVPEFSWDESVREDDLEVPGDFCGAPLGTALEG
jgi:hypothetical protein